MVKANILNSQILKFLIKRIGIRRFLLGFALFLLPPRRRTFSLLKKTAHSRMGAIGKCHADGKARFHECMMLPNSSGDIVPVFFKSFFFFFF
jgi:hypothetical protein